MKVMTSKQEMNSAAEMLQSQKQMQQSQPQNNITALTTSSEQTTNKQQPNSQSIVATSADETPKTIHKGIGLQTVNKGNSSANYNKNGSKSITIAEIGGGTSSIQAAENINSSKQQLPPTTSQQQQHQQIYEVSPTLKGHQMDQQFADAVTEQKQLQSAAVAANSNTSGGLITSIFAQQQQPVAQSDVPGVLYPPGGGGASFTGLAASLTMTSGDHIHQAHHSGLSGNWKAVPQTTKYRQYQSSAPGNVALRQPSKMSSGATAAEAQRVAEDGGAGNLNTSPPPPFLASAATSKHQQQKPTTQASPPQWIGKVTVGAPPQLSSSGVTAPLATGGSVSSQQHDQMTTAQQQRNSQLKKQTSSTQQQQINSQLHSSHKRHAAKQHMQAESSQETHQQLQMQLMQQQMLNCVITNAQSTANNANSNKITGSAPRQRKIKSGKKRCISSSSITTTTMNNTNQPQPSQFYQQQPSTNLTTNQNQQPESTLRKYNNQQMQQKQSNSRQPQLNKGTALQNHHTSTNSSTAPLNAATNNGSSSIPRQKNNYHHNTASSHHKSHHHHHSSSSASKHQLKIQGVMAGAQIMNTSNLMAQQAHNLHKIQQQKQQYPSIATSVNQQQDEFSGNEQQQRFNSSSDSKHHMMAASALTVDQIHPNANIAPSLHIAAGNPNLTNSAKQPGEPSHYTNSQQMARKTAGGNHHRQLMVQQQKQQKPQTTNPPMLTMNMVKPLHQYNQQPHALQNHSCKSLDSVGEGTSSQYQSSNNGVDVLLNNAINCIGGVNTDQHHQNFNSLRNSKQSNRKMSSTAAKRSKKLKKSESQVRHHQNQNKKQTQQHSGAPEHEVDTTLGASGYYQQNPQQQQPAFIQPTPKASIQTQQQAVAHQRGTSNRTPQSYIVAEGSKNELHNGGSSASNHNKQNFMIENAAAAANSSACSRNKAGNIHSSTSYQPLILNGINSGAGIGAAGGAPITATAPVQTNSMMTAANSSSNNAKAYHQHQKNQQATIDTIFRQHHNNSKNQGGGSQTDNKVQFHDFKSQFGGDVGDGSADHRGNGKPYKLMKSAERGEINTHNFVMCNYHHQVTKPHHNHQPHPLVGDSRNQPCICQAHQPYPLMSSTMAGGNVNNTAPNKEQQSCSTSTATTNLLIGKQQIKASFQSTSQSSQNHNHHNKATTSQFGGAATQTFRGKSGATAMATGGNNNFMYHGGAARRSNDFSTIQQSTISKNQQQQSQFPSQKQQYNSVHNSTSQNPFSSAIHYTPPNYATSGSGAQAASLGAGGLQDLHQQTTASDLAASAGSQQNGKAATGGLPTNSQVHPMMNDLLRYLQQAYQNQQESIGANPAASCNQAQSQASTNQQQTQKQLVQQLLQHQQSKTQQQPQVASASKNSGVNNQTTAQKGDGVTGQNGSSSTSNKLIHFEKGDRIIYEPNDMHQLKYINDKGEVSPITGVQYILTQPNFSKGRPCHFFVVNKQEFEAATRGLAQKAEEQKADELIKQRKLQAMANIRSHRASQKLSKANNNNNNNNAATGSGGTTTAGGARGKKGTGFERRVSAKGGRDGAASGGVASNNKEAAEKGTRGDEETKIDTEKEKDKYHNELYTYQKLRSLKWMGGPYRNPHDDQGPIWRPSAEEQEIRQQLEAKREIKAKYNLLSLNKQGAPTELYKYILLLGNNQDVVKRVMESRPSWAQIKSSQTLYNFKWAPSSRQIKFDFLGKHGQKHLVNHFENHALITTKDQLIESMSKLCENLHQDMFNYIPVTFVIDLGTPLCQHEFDRFNYYFNLVEKHKEQFINASDATAQQEVLAHLNRNIQTYQTNSERKRKFTTIAMRDTLFNGHNIWLFKPADANRGRGVNLFSTLEQLKRLILEHTNRAETKQFQTFAATNNLHSAAIQAVGGTTSQLAAHNSNNTNGGLSTSQDHSQGGAAAATINSNATGYAAANSTTNGGEKPASHANIKADVFVVQKYIEKPLLINQRKFDIRLWVLVTPEHKCYYFKEGYIRMSGQPYDLNQVDNVFVHLTNNAIQKHGTNYGQYEEGNILSFKEGSDFLKKQDNIDIDFYKMYKEEMVPIIETTLMSVRQKLNKNNRKFCMEIFGYDFMVDSAMRPWLIEVNTNPCLEESNQLLRHLIPRMLDDAFKLTLDVMFPPLTPAKIAEALNSAAASGDQEGGNAAAASSVDQQHSRSVVFSVPGYRDDENLWGDQPFYILRVPGQVIVHGS